jgi:hypothetical protein
MTAPLTTEVRDALANLGSTPDEVALTLAKLGIKGIPSAIDCPGKRWLDLRFGRLDWKVTANDVSWARPHSADRNVVPLPSQVTLFIRGFDLGHYPELADSDLPAVCDCSTCKAWHQNIQINKAQRAVRATAQSLGITWANDAVPVEVQA